MDVQIHKNDVRVDEEPILELVSHHLGRFSERLTRLDVFLRDENAGKGGEDKRCLLEARPRGLDPVTAEDRSSVAIDALAGATKKLERMLDHRLGRLEDRERH